MIDQISYWMQINALWLGVVGGYIVIAIIFYGFFNAYDKHLREILKQDKEWIIPLRVLISSLLWFVFALLFLMWDRDAYKHGWTLQ